MSSTKLGIILRGQYVALPIDKALYGFPALNEKDEFFFFDQATGEIAARIAERLIAYLVLLDPKDAVCRSAATGLTEVVVQYALPEDWTADQKQAFRAQLGYGLRGACAAGFALLKLAGPLAPLGVLEALKVLKIDPLEFVAERVAYEGLIGTLNFAWYKFIGQFGFSAFPNIAVVEGITEPRTKFILANTVSEGIKAAAQPDFTVVQNVEDLKVGILLAFVIVGTRGSVDLVTKDNEVVECKIDVSTFAASDQCMIEFSNNFTHTLAGCYAEYGKEGA